MYLRYSCWSKSIWSAVGYQSGKSQSSSQGTIVDQTDYNVTGFIEVAANQTIRVKNIDVSTENSRNNVEFYNSSFVNIATSTLKSASITYGTNEGNGVYSKKTYRF